MATLTRITGPEAGTAVQLSNPTLVIGRSSECDVVLDDRAVSGRHAKISREGDTWIIEDLESSNGIEVNRRHVTMTQLHDGDSVSVGDTEFFFRVSAAAPASAAPVEATPAPRPDEGPPSEGDRERAERLRLAYRTIRDELAKFIVGQEEVLEQLLIAMLSRGHCLLEGVPGLAKTAIVRSLSQVLDLSFKRIQFTPDLMPADITGTDIIQEDSTTGHRQLVFQRGPIFAHMVLADEINRTPPKTQAALLEAMEEHAVTVGNRTFPLQEPFFVLATQNPIEQEGTYPLPEAQRDRFMFHVNVPYPSRDQEREIIERTTGTHKADLQQVLSAEVIIDCQNIVRGVPVPDHVTEMVLDVSRCCRPKEDEAVAAAKGLIEWGPGPRAGQMLVLGGKVRALLRGRYHVTTDDIEALAYPVLRHRIVPTFNAEAEGIDADEIIRRVLATLPRRKAEPVL